MSEIKIELSLSNKEVELIRKLTTPISCLDKDFLDMIRLNTKIDNALLDIGYHPSAGGK